MIIDNTPSNLFTVIEVNGLDRTGLLYELTSALSELNLNIGSAHISTFGERVVDGRVLRHRPDRPEDRELQPPQGDPPQRLIRCSGSRNLVFSKSRRQQPSESARLWLKET